MAEYKEWAVELIVTTEHTYTVVARTPEEAVEEAETRFDSGDEGEVTATSVDTADAISTEEFIETEYIEP